MLGDRRTRLLYVAAGRRRRRWRVVAVAVVDDLVGAARPRVPGARGPAARTVLGGATGPALIPVLQQTGLAELLWAALVAGLLVCAG